jgi:CRISPR-associated endonuclease/helicase Cas3
MMGLPPSRSYWGKLTRNAAGDITHWHRLSSHCADVAAVGQSLLYRVDTQPELSLLGRRLAHVLGRSDLSRGTVAKLVVLMALHDIGKFNHGFQAKRDPTQRMTAGHVSEALVLLDDNESARPWGNRLWEILGDHGILAWGDGAVPLLAAAISHHGRPGVPAQPLRAQAAAWWEANSERDPLAGIADLVAATRRWCPEAFEIGPDLPEDPGFQHAFCGLVQLADWLGSDTEFFPYSTPDEVDRWEFARQAAERALTATRLSTSVIFPPKC